jgi:hypothetical protein
MAKHRRLPLFKSCDGVELEFPGLDWFDSMPRSTNPKEEDAHHNGIHANAGR